MNDKAKFKHKTNKNVVFVWFQQEGAPLDLLLLATYIADKGFNPYVLICPEPELTRSKINRESLTEWVKKEIIVHSPIALGLSLYSKDVAKGIVVSEIFREYSRAPIIWGGWHPTLYPESTAACEVVDYVVIGDGEGTLWELLECICQSRMGRDIRGIACRVDGKIVINPKREPINYTNCKPISYKFLQPGHNSKNIYGEEQIFAGKGCPYRCKYCVNASFPRKYTAVNAKTLVEQIVERYEATGCTYFRFEDDVFFENKKRLIELINLLEKLPFSIKWAAQSTIKMMAESTFIDDELLLALHKSGLYMVIMGIESGSKRILKLINKKTSDPELVIPAVKRITNLGMIALFNHIIGFPEETLDDIKETFNSIDKLYKIPNVAINGPFLYRPYPGTDLYKKCLELGFKEPQTLEGWADVYDEKGIRHGRCPWIGDEIYYLHTILDGYCRTKNTQLHSIFDRPGSSAFRNFPEKEKIRYKKAVEFLRKANWKRSLRQRVKKEKRKEKTISFVRNVLIKTHTRKFVRSVRRRINL